MRTLLMQPAMVALCAACLVAPAAIPVETVAARTDVQHAPVVVAPLDLVALTAALPAAPTLLDVLGLQIQTVSNVLSANTTGAVALPPGFPLTAAQYVSLFQVLNAYINVAQKGGAQFLQGQWESILPTAQANLALANTALNGFPASVQASLGYDFGVIQAFFENLGNATTFSGVSDGAAVLATPDVAAPAALPAAPTLLDVLGLQIQTVSNVLSANTTGAVALPPGFPLTAAQYVSLFQVLNAYINVAQKAGTQFLQGQWESILPTAQANLALANTALNGFPASVQASLGYDFGVIQAFLSGGATGLNAAAGSAATALVAKNADAAAPAALPAAPTLLDVLGLQIQTVSNVLSANTTGAVALPPGFPLTAAQYVSAFQVANAYINVAQKAGTQFLQGQWESILPTAQANLALANTALNGFPASVQASLGYDAAVVSTYLKGLGLGAPSGAVAKDTVQLAAKTAPDTDVTATVKELTPTPATKVTATTGSTGTGTGTTDQDAKTPAVHGSFLHRLQSAVDTEIGGSAPVKVGNATPAKATPGDGGDKADASAPTTGKRHTTSASDSHGKGTAKGSSTSGSKSAAGAK